LTLNYDDVARALREYGLRLNHSYNHFALNQLAKMPMPLNIRSLQLMSALTLWAGGLQAEVTQDTVLGEWVGTYTCAQGLTGLTLTIAEATPTRARALFHFYADSRNPRVPSGCFTMDGAYDPASGQLRLEGRDWLLRPNGYYVVHFDGDIDARGERFSGKVRIRNCGTFDLTRAPSPVELPPKCLLADAPAASQIEASAGVIANSLGDGGRIDLKILFDFGAATILAHSAAQLDELGRILLSPELIDRRVAILGHTDSVGTADDNRALSARRAISVRDYLITNFLIPSERFEVEGHGEDRLKLSNAPEDAANRRVEIALLD
jgi:outer membrane protein OmpA-like peptidoglycan-associated protein